MNDEYDVTFIVVVLEDDEHEVLENLKKYVLIEEDDDIENIDIDEVDEVHDVTFIEADLIDDEAEDFIAEALQQIVDDDEVED